MPQRIRHYTRHQNRDHQQRQRLLPQRQLGRGTQQPHLVADLLEPGIWGDSVILNPNATFNASPFLKGSNATWMRGNAPAGTFVIQVAKTGSGSLNLMNDYNNVNTHFYINSGAFHAPGRTLNVRSIDNPGYSNTSSIDISNARITAVTNWRYNGSTAVRALNAAGSTITAANVYIEGFTYNKLNVGATVATSGTMNNAVIDSLVFTNPSPASAIGIYGANNTLNYVEYKGAGGIYGTGNKIDTLLFFPGNRYTLTSGTNTTITGEWFGSGTPCRLTEIVSSGATNAVITKPSGSVRFDYVRLQRITGTGGATYSSQSHTIDLGGNTGWTIAPYDGAAPIYGFGPDRMVTPADFPITLRTDGFFGDPSSQYVWNDNSTGDSLVVTGPGTYSVQVNFVDGCNIKDTIAITMASTLPITLGDLAARVQDDCKGVQLNWSTSSEQNSKDFTVQRSTDGERWNTIGTVGAAGTSNTLIHYGMTDSDLTGEGLYHYRLRLNDIDGRSKFSPVITVKPACHSFKYLVYPNPVKQSFIIQLPADGKRKLVSVYNAAGQPEVQANLNPGSVHTVFTTHWKQGVYLLVVSENGKQVYQQKVVKL